MLHAGTYTLPIRSTESWIVGQKVHFHREQAQWIRVNMQSVNFLGVKRQSKQQCNQISNNKD